MHRLLPSCFFLLCVWLAPVSAEQPLHVRIDKIIDGTQIGPQSRVSSDAEFLRRIYLDLTGVIPSAQQARQFLDDKGPDKRAKLVDRLLSSPQYVRHLTDSLHLMLMERRTNAGDWVSFLRTSVERNKPWNQLAAEILSTDGADAKLRGPINYYTARSVEPNLMTREIGRFFFGMDLQCAQCHDHPLIDDYLQRDYYGIFAFVNRTYLFQPDKKKPAVLAEKAEGDAKFKSVFTGDEGATAPRLPGAAEIAEPTFKKGEEYKVKPDKKNKKIRPIPKYSRRGRLGELVAKGENMAFRRNIVNRLWAHMMGRGLVHPPDLHHSDNPPSHPKLLDLLANEFAAMKFDIKAFLRELALTNTYQRSISLPDRLVEQAGAMAPRLAELEAEQNRFQKEKAETAKAADQAKAELAKAKKALAEVVEQLKKANAAMAAAKKERDPLAKAAAEAQKQLAAKQGAAGPLETSAARTEEALKLLSGDKELAAILGKLQARTKVLNSQISELSKTAAQHESAAKAAAEKVATAEQSAAKLSATQASTNKQIASTQLRSKELAQKVAGQALAVGVARRRKTTVKTFLEYTKRLKAANASIQAAEKVLVELRPLQASVEKTRGQLKNEQQQLSAAQKAKEQAEKLLAKVKEQLAIQSAAVQAMTEAAQKTASAQKLLAQDAQLKELNESLGAKTQAISNVLTKLQKEMPERESQAKSAAAGFEKARQAIGHFNQTLADLEKRKSDLAAKAKPFTDQAAKDQAALDKPYEELTKHWSEHFVIGALEPLTPEQMAWSVLQATGLIDKQRAASAAEINKKKPLKPEEQKDPAKLAARQKEIEQAVSNKLKGNVGVFVKLFGASAGQPQYDFFATAEQALFFANGGQLRSWLAPSGTNLTGRLIKLTDPQKLAEELYLSVLTRRPTLEETADVTEYLKARPKERNAVVQELAWALLTSNEFRFHP